MDITQSLRSAGNGISNLAAKAVTGASGLYDDAATAVRGLRMPGTAPVAPAAPTAASAAPAAPSAPLPTIDPAMAPSAAQGMRASARPPIPVLTDEVHIPGMTNGPMPPAPELKIPVLNNEIPAGHPALQPISNPSFATGTSPEAAAWQASRAAPVAEAAPSLAARAATGLRGAVGTVADNAPTKGGILGGGLAGAASFAPHWDAMGEDKLDAGQKAKLLVRDTTRAIGGIVGAGAGGAVGSVVPVAGTIAGGVLGGAAGYEGVDALGGGLRRGLNYVNEKLGGSPNYITSTDDDLRNAGYDPNKSLFNMGGKPAPAVAGGAAPPPAPSTPADIAEFNRRMGEVGASDVGMRVGTGGPDSRVIGNTAPASQAMQDYTTQHMDQRTNQLANAEAQYARDESRRQDGLRMSALAQPADMSSYDKDIAAATASGSVARVQAAYAAKENAQRVASADRATTMQAQTAMRGQDTTADDARLANQTAMVNGMRQAAIAQRSYGLDVAKFNADQAKTSVEQRDKGETDLSTHLGKMFTTQDGKGNVVPDAARVGDASQAIMNEIGARIADARAVPPNSPHYAEAQHLAQQLSSKGVAALEPDDMQTLLSQAAIRDRVKQTHGLTPGSSTFVDSRLGGYSLKGVEPNLIGSDTLRLNNGGVVRANDLRYNEPANTFLPDFKQRTDQFDAGLGLRSKR